MSYVYFTKISLSHICEKKTWQRTGYLMANDKKILQFQLQRDDLEKQSTQ